VKSLGLYQLTASNYLPAPLFLFLKTTKPIVIVCLF